MRHITILLACMLAIGTASAQDKMVAIKGTVTDAKTKEALPGVTIYVQEGYHYTQTNGDGIFIIKVPEKMLGGNLIFSAFGYNRDTLEVKAVQKKPNVKLRAGSTVVLSEVNINEYRPISLIQEAVNRIPQNYWTDSAIGTFFYRDVRQVNDSLYLFDEMVFDALRVGYDKHHTLKRLKRTYDDPEARPIESNYKSILFSRLLVNDTAYINELTNHTGSSYLEYSDNDVLYEPVEVPRTTVVFSSRKRLQKMWDYKMETFSDADGEEYYYVTMTHDGKFFGHYWDTVWVTIARSDLSIVKIENSKTTQLNNFPWPLNEGFEKIGVDSLKWEVHGVYNYGIIDGKRTLTSYSRHNTTNYYHSNGIHGEPEQHFVLDAQCVLTSQRRGDASFLDTANIQSPKRIAVSERQAGELRYDEEFWDQYNFVPLENTLLRKLNARLKKK